MLGLRAPASIDAQEPAAVGLDEVGLHCFESVDPPTTYSCPSVSTHPSTLSSQPNTHTLSQQRLLKRPAPAAADGDTGGKRQAI